MDRPIKYSEDMADFLIELRDSGAINMMGAAQYLMESFGLTRKEAAACLVYWMQEVSK